MMLAALLAACGSPGPDDPGEVEASGPLVVTDAHNYSYTGSLDVVETSTAAGADASIDWSGLTADLRGRPVVPAEVDQLALIAFAQRREDILAAISVNDLSQSEVADYRLFMNDEGRTEAMLSEFSVFGNDFVPESEFVARDAVGSWAVALQDEVNDRLDILTLEFLAPETGGSGTAVVIDDSSAKLDFVAELGVPLVVTEASTMMLDWSGLTTEAGGQPFDDLRADRLFLGHVPLEDEREIEARFVSILDLADAVYQLDVYGETEADLTLAVDDDGAAFSGFEAGGTWMVGLECTMCTSPAPVLLMRMDVR